ncbi:RNA-directed DNA polymerase, eukaryota, reverse transcriptase zinc-binding domain protein [Tanacetum coccineum]
MIRLVGRSDGRRRVGSLGRAKDPLVIMIAVTDHLPYTCYGNIKSVLTQKGLDTFCYKLHIPDDVHPQLPSPNQTIHEMLAGKNGVYTRFFEYANFCLPLSTFLVNVLRHYRINLSQLSVIATAKVSHFEILCRVHSIEPTVELLRCFYVNSKNKGWMSFSLKNYIEAAEDEEKLLMQKAKVNWLKEEDKNTAYFHKVLKGRLNRSIILSICAEDGTRFENYEVANQNVKHFEGFLGISPSNDVTEEEIKKALFDIDDNKAPGPDGFTSKFFKKSWDIVKRDFCAAIKEFFNTGKILGEVNATLIFLVPKMLTPQKVSDFRPIACCNVIYKCISKILTNRIKSALNHIVDDNQSIFVPGRAITDNILLTQELLKGYNCAYDTICWRFIKDILRRFGFPERMVMWIMTCVASTKFTICVNGERYGYFNGGRGLRHATSQFSTLPPPFILSPQPGPMQPPFITTIVVTHYQSIERIDPRLTLPPRKMLIIALGPTIRRFRQDPERYVGYGNYGFWDEMLEPTGSTAWYDQWIRGESCLRAEVMSLRTTVLAQMSEITELQSADRSRRRAISDLLETDRGRRKEMRELRAADRTRQQQIIQTLTVMQTLQRR